jgi:hypothetical protein
MVMHGIRKIVMPVYAGDAIVVIGESLIFDPRESRIDPNNVNYCFIDRRSIGRRDEADAHRIAGEAGDIVDVEPLHDLRAVGLDGLDADRQAFGDIACGIAFGDELQDLALARGECARLIRGLGSQVSQVLCDAR